MAEVMNTAAAVQRAFGAAPLQWLKLHKLLYFCQAWSLVWAQKPLFSNPLEAWRRGPAVREVYRVQKYFPTSPAGNADALTASESQIVTETVRFYGRYRTHQLVELVHREPPWRLARKGVPADESSKNVITHESIQQYFSLLSEPSPYRVPEGVSRTIDVLLSIPEDDVDTRLDDSGVNFDDELAYLRGTGPNPWPQTQQPG